MLKSNKSNKNNKYTWLSFLILAFIFKLIMAAIIKGHPTDINCFKAWADYAASKGLHNFYSGEIFADYPPGYIYILYLLGKIRSIFKLDYNSTAFLILIKMPAIIADMICAYLILKLSKKRLGYNKAFALSMIYALNPSIIVNSSIWGQVDSIFTLFVFLTLMYLTQKRFEMASIAFVVAVLIKPQSLMFLPIIIFVCIWTIKRSSDSKASIRIGKSVFYGLIVFIISILPFTIKKSPFWIINHYKNTLASYPYATLNAFNLFALTGGNWVEDTTKILLFSYKTWGYIFIIGIVIFSTYLYFKSKGISKIYFISLFIMTSVFVLTSKMHERYLFPAIILALMSYVYTQDNRILHVYIGLSITHFINVAYVLSYNLKEIYHLNASDPILILVSIANIAILIYIVVAGIDIYGISHKSRKFKKIKLNYNILLILLTLIYSVIAFYNLGDIKAPETFWKPAKPGESFYVDFGEVKNIDRIYYYGGIGEGEYNIDISDDALNWENVDTITQKEIYVWRYLEQSFSTQYIKVTVQKPGAMLNELGFFEMLNQTPLTVENIVKQNIEISSQGRVENLFDEQDIIAYTPSFMNGMYFDEIYHARTAYEHLNKIEPYESTHPPLGKIFISIGIAIFGMNPFGWRVIGTIFGIAMVPIMYIFGKRLFKSEKYGFIAAFLISFDFMHFTQTRIATIDVYGVFFIILMYYFMYKYYTLNFYKVGLKKTLIPLMFCGLFFGIGVACKWISMYAGAGLAIIFFASMYERYKEYKKAKQAIKLRATKRVGKLNLSNFENDTYVTEVFIAYFIKTIVWCIIFFILIPTFIYFLSYIPFMMVSGPGHKLKDVISYQKHMYDYHKNIKATHPFSSLWWEWPLLRKPMWYYSGKPYIDTSRISSIVAMGNPAIWWISIPAVITALFISLKKKEKEMFVILVGFISQYAPWILVSRLVFIYHFFASTPFVILCITYAIKNIAEKFPKSKVSIYGYMAIVCLLFVMFYPILSGVPVNEVYAVKVLKWFKGWYF